MLAGCTLGHELGFASVEYLLAACGGCSGLGWEWQYTQPSHVRAACATLIMSGVDSVQAVLVCVCGAVWPKFALACGDCNMLLFLPPARAGVRDCCLCACPTNAKV